MNQKGITLIEILIALCISAIVMAAGFQLFINQVKIFEMQEAIADSQNAVRAGMQIIIDDLRMAGYNDDPGDPKVPVGVPVQEKSKIRIDWEQEDKTIKAVEYFIEATELKRRICLDDCPDELCEKQVVLDKVTGLTFVYIRIGTKVVGADVTLTVKNRTLFSTVIFRNLI